MKLEETIIPDLKIIKPKINDVPETPIKGRYPVKLIGTEKIPIFSHGNPDIIQERIHSKINIKDGTSNTKMSTYMVIHHRAVLVLL